MRKAKLFGLVLILALTGTGRAYACSCIQIGNADAVNAAKGTDAVFRAQVMSTALLLTSTKGAVAYKNQKQPLQGYLQRIVVLRVEEIYKGEIPPMITLVTGLGAGDCGYVFKAQVDYIVFASTTKEGAKTALVGTPQAWTTSICSFTQPAAEAGDLPQSLKKKFGSREPVWLEDETLSVR